MIIFIDDIQYFRIVLKILRQEKIYTKLSKCNLRINEFTDQAFL